ncbi:MAG: ABC transporter permease [Peptococcaceae bacterium]|nr:ABC transporter permease [Peptococcaceae bacterium]
MGKQKIWAKDLLEVAGVPAIAIILGLVVGAVAMLWMGYNPVIGYQSLLRGIFGDAYSFGETIRSMTPLIFTGLAVAFAFRTGLFNIGVEGQFVLGMLAGALVGAAWPQLPWLLHVGLALGAGALAGALWAAVPGLLKGRFGVHEVITTIMLNYVSLILANYLIRNFFRVQEQEATANIAPSADLSIALLKQASGGARIHWGTVVALGLVVLVAFILYKTTLGFEFRAVGFNPHAAQYGGINVTKSLILSMLISGSIAGVGGAVEILGVFGRMAVSPILPGVGFDGIAVALIGNNNPFGVLFGSFLFGALKTGAIQMQYVTQVPYAIIRVVIAAIVFFVAIKELVRRILRLKRREV